MIDRMQQDGSETPEAMREWIAARRAEVANAADFSDKPMVLRAFDAARSILDREEKRVAALGARGEGKS